MVDLLTDPRQLAERLLEWARDPVVLALRLAGTDRALVREAYRILETEVLPAAVAREVDADIVMHGVPSDEELEAREREALAKPQRKFTAADQARLTAIVKEVAADVRAEFPDVTPEEGEQITYARLRAVANRVV